MGRHRLARGMPSTLPLTKHSGATAVGFVAPAGLLVMTVFSQTSDINERKNENEEAFSACCSPALLGWLGSTPPPTHTPPQHIETTWPQSHIKSEGIRYSTCIVRGAYYITRFFAHAAGSVISTRCSASCLYRRGTHVYSTRSIHRMTLDAIAHCNILLSRGTYNNIFISGMTYFGCESRSVGMFLVPFWCWKEID